MNKMKKQENLGRGSKQASAWDKKKRLADALRENLVRRKSKNETKAEGEPDAG
jgi:hypothetical protein